MTKQTPKTRAPRIGRESDSPDQPARAKTAKPKQPARRPPKPAEEAPGGFAVRIGQALARLIGGPPEADPPVPRSRPAAHPPPTPGIPKSDSSTKPPPAAKPARPNPPARPATKDPRPIQAARATGRSVTPRVTIRQSAPAAPESRPVPAASSRSSVEAESIGSPSSTLPLQGASADAWFPLSGAEEGAIGSDQSDFTGLGDGLDRPSKDPAASISPEEADLDDGVAPVTAETPRPRLTGAARRYGAIIEETLAEFGVPVRVVHAETGPTLIRLGIAPGYLQRPARRDQPARRERVKAAKVVARANDLALALGVTSLRIEAPVPGKNYIGVEVPNPTPRAVPLAPLLEEPEFRALLDRGVLPFALGRGVAGPPILADLARLPHLLIAGATGSGKSVAVNALIGTLLHTRTPADVRIIVVDPKRVEFTWLAGVPHLLTPVVTEPEEAVNVLGKVETEMAHRYDLLAEAGCRNRLAYNARHRPPLPALVVVIDELADLMMLASDDVERSICRVAQLGRAAGIHLVVATQRPSVDVITGLIKANLPARLAFAVSSLVDSRTILDTPGAERLLGRGDFLYLSPEAMRPVRGQGALARDSWLKQAVRSARAGVPPGTKDPEAERFAKLLSAAQIAEDRLYLSARELAQEHAKVSASFLQRKLRIGYNKAVALVERLRADGILADPELDDD